jgi:hypothetical protein
MTSAVGIETGENTRTSPPRSAAERALIIPAAAGAALFWIFNPSEAAWWVGVGLLAASLISVCAVQLLRGRHDP